MTWWKSDDRFPEHKKVRRLSDKAFRLHVTACCFCSKDENDGVFTPEDVDEMVHGKRLKKWIGQLEDAGLWERIPGGWHIHDFLKYNPSHEQLERDRERARERQRRAREKREAKRDGVMNQEEVTA